ncbi:hypothetical protein ACOSQ3_010195 [Xanthoceras sorbifolium]
MPVPLPDPIIRTRLLVEPDADVVFFYGDGLARVGFEQVDLPEENGLDDFLFELGFFFGKLGFARVIIIIGRIGEVGCIEEQVFEGLVREDGAIRWTDLEATHQILEEEIVKISLICQKKNSLKK